jgi:hydroxypyruvate isomerase
MPRLAANLSFLWPELPFLNRFQAARASGFDAVEFMFPGDGAYRHTAAEIGAELERCDLSLVLMNSPSGDWGAGERGVGGLAHREDEWQASLRTGLAYASELGSPSLHVMAGLTTDGADEDVFVDRLCRAGAEAASTRMKRWRRGRRRRRTRIPDGGSGSAVGGDDSGSDDDDDSGGVRLCVEVLNPHDFPDYLVPDLETALRIVERVEACARASVGVTTETIYDSTFDSTDNSTRGRRGTARGGNVALQLDLYHVAMTEGTDGAAMARAVDRYLPHTAHVEVANPPGRNEPGVGDVAFDPLFAQLEAAGYDGWVGCEYRPSGTKTTEESLEWATPYLSSGSSGVRPVLF